MKFWILSTLLFITIVVLVTGMNEWNEKIKAAGTKDFDTYDTLVARTESKERTLPSPDSKIEPIKLAILGSAATSEDPQAWPALLEQELKNKVGSSLVEVTVKGISNKTSQEIVKEKLYKDLIEEKPDILLIEPFLLFDNGKIKMAKRLENLDYIINDFKKANSRIEILIQPPNPIYGTYFYPKEEYDLQRYAKRQGYTYLDHWKAWPPITSKELKSYLTGNYMPNQKGNELWANYLAEHLLIEK